METALFVYLSYYHKSGLFRADFVVKKRKLPHNRPFSSSFCGKKQENYHITDHFQAIFVVSKTEVTHMAERPSGYFLRSKKARHADDEYHLQINDYRRLQPGI